MRCVARLPTSYRSPKTSLICRACDARNLIAAVRHSMRSSSSNGLLRKPTAPLSSARFRCFSFGKAVIKMTGVWYPCDCNAYCNSSPFNPGICKSVISMSSSRSDQSRGNAPRIRKLRLCTLMIRQARVCHRRPVSRHRQSKSTKLRTFRRPRLGDALESSNQNQTHIQGI